MTRRYEERDRREARGELRRGEWDRRDEPVERPRRAEPVELPRRAEPVELPRRDGRCRAAGAPALCRVACRVVQRSFPFVSYFFPEVYSSHGGVTTCRRRLGSR